MVNKNTLGVTLRSIQKKFVLLEEFPEIMEEALKARNRFTHHIFREFGLKIHSVEGRAEMLTVINELSTSMQEVYNIASPISERLLKEHLHAKQNS